MSEPEQLDIFIPLHRRERLREWARLALANQLEVAHPGGVMAFASWLREHGHAPPDLSEEALTVLVAVMQDYEGSVAQGALAKAVEARKQRTPIRARLPRGGTLAAEYGAPPNGS